MKTTPKIGDILYGCYLDPYTFKAEYYTYRVVSTGILGGEVVVEEVMDDGRVFEPFYAKLGCLFPTKEEARLNATKVLGRNMKQSVKHLSARIAGLRAERRELEELRKRLATTFDEI